MADDWLGMLTPKIREIFDPLGLSVRYTCEPQWITADPSFDAALSPNPYIPPRKRYESSFLRDYTVSGLGFVATIRADAAPINSADSGDVRVSFAGDARTPRFHQDSYELMMRGQGIIVAKCLVRMYLIFRAAAALVPLYPEAAIEMNRERVNLSGEASTTFYLQVGYSFANECFFRFQFTGPMFSASVSEGVLVRDTHYDDAAYARSIMQLLARFLADMEETTSGAMACIKPKLQQKVPDVYADGCRGG